jgi:translation initiation factor IF-1
LQNAKRSTEKGMLFMQMTKIELFSKHGELLCVVNGKLNNEVWTGEGDVLKTGTVAYSKPIDVELETKNIAYGENVVVKIKTTSL